jgi:hypothetical protein
MGAGKDCITDNELYIFFCFIGPSVLAKLTLKPFQRFKKTVIPNLCRDCLSCVSQTLEKPTCARNR